MNERIVKGLKGDDEEGYGGGGEEKTHEEKEAPEETEGKEGYRQELFIC